MNISLLPQILRDKSNLIIEKCIHKAFNIDLNPFMLYLLDNVDIRLLKFLAYQFHILGDEGWNLAQTEQEQRDLIKMAIRVHRIKGTKRAIQYVLTTLGVENEIREWFEYGGKPYRFKLFADIDKLSDNETNILLERYIENFKNKRSRFEGVQFLLNDSSKFFIGIGEADTIYTTYNCIA